LPLLAAFAIIVLGGCGGSDPTYNLTPTMDDTDFTLTSPAFTQGQPIPRLNGRDGSNKSPALQWTEPPAGTKSLALIMDDPDAPGMTWVHWVLYGLPPTSRSLPEEVKPDASGPDGSKQGNNSWDQIGYGGPQPPSGTHRYFFRLYALDTENDLSSGATASQLKDKMQGHVLAVAELMGTFSK
jgi:Raf kinase inhibitor-like YbhB/YbcL family protein